MTVTHAKKPVLCGECGHAILVGQLMRSTSGPEHVDCTNPNMHREWPDWVDRGAVTAEPTPITEPSGVPGVVRVRYGLHVAEGTLGPTGPDSFAFKGVLVCGPHDADGGHLVAADQEGTPMTTNRPGGEAAVSPRFGGSLPADHSGWRAGQSSIAPEGVTEL